jgi:hypothetical protein
MIESCLHKSILPSSAPPCPSTASLSATKHSIFFALTASPASCGSKTPSPTTASRVQLSTVVFGLYALVLVDRRHAGRPAWPLVLHVHVSYLYKYVPELRQQTFAQRLRYENRQFNLDVLSSPSPFINVVCEKNCEWESGSFRIVPPPMWFYSLSGREGLGDWNGWYFEV